MKGELNLARRRAGGGDPASGADAPARTRKEAEFGRDIEVRMVCGVESLEPEPEVLTLVLPKRLVQAKMRGEQPRPGRVLRPRSPR
jgi:hypothetical protein